MKRRLGTAMTMAVLLASMMLGATPALAANPAADLDQCANDPLPSPSTDGCNSSPGQWVNGNLGASKSVYFEGDSIPYRMRFSNLQLAPVHHVIIEWDTTKAGKHALDYIDNVDQSVNGLPAINPCLGVSGCSAYNTASITADPQVTAANVTPIGASPGIRVYGGNTISLTRPAHVGNVTCTAANSAGPYCYENGTGFAGDKTAAVQVNFIASVPNPVMAWGGHIATRKDWTATGGAGTISGSPYHMRLIDLDGAGGNQDRSLSAEAVIFPGSITIIKDATPNGATSFSFTGSPSPLTNFSLVDDGTSANTKVFSKISTFQTYTVNETPIPSNWGFDSVSCSVLSGNGGSATPTGASVAIAMKEGEDWTCTYLDSQRFGTLTVIKHVVNDNGGAATASQWSLHVKSGSSEVSNSPQAGSESGTSYTLLGGSYTVSESGGPSGYTLTGFSGDCDSSGVVTVVTGQNKTCTLTNNDNAPGLTLIKHVVNDNGGTADASAWTLHAGSHAVAGSESGAVATMQAGTYALSESGGPSTYTQTSLTCDDAPTTQVTSVTIGLGESKTCTFVNDDNAPSLTLVKHVTNDNGGTAVAGNWTLNAGSNTVTGSEAGSLATTIAGTYALSETDGPAHYTQTSLTCDDAPTTQVTSVTIGLGESKTCTFVNDDDAPSLVLKKHVVNDNGDDATADEWTLYADALSVTGSETGTEVTDQAGSYDLSESTGPAGYTNTSITCDNDPGKEVTSVTLGLGQTISCTFVNDDSPASPSISTDVDAQIRDNVAITGRGTPTGTVDFHLFTNSGCIGPEYGSDLGVTLDASGKATSKWFDVSSSNTYYWRDDYSGDTNNAPKTGDCGEAITVTSASFNPQLLAGFAGLALPVLLWGMWKRRKEDEGIDLA
jgi:hypothetical protein